MGRFINTNDAPTGLRVVSWCPMTKAPQSWTVLLAVAPPLLEELLATLLGRVDLQMSILGPSSDPPRRRKFDVAVHDHPLPAWIEVDQCLPIQAALDDVATPPLRATQLMIENVEGLRLALRALCPPRGIGAVAS